MKIALDPGAIAPTRAHPTDAGLDLYAPHDIVMMIGDRVTVDTGVHIALPPNTYGDIRGRSSMIKRDLYTSGTVDEPYRGAIGVTLHNQSGEIVRIKRGERIAQMVIAPCLYESVETVDKLNETDRGSNGFGSTGK